MQQKSNGIASEIHLGIRLDEKLTWKTKPKMFRERKFYTLQKLIVVHYCSMYNALTEHLKNYKLFATNV